MTKENNDNGGRTPLNIDLIMEEYEMEIAKLINETIINRAYIKQLEKIIESNKESKESNDD